MIELAWIGAMVMYWYYVLPVIIFMFVLAAKGYGSIMVWGFVIFSGFLVYNHENPLPVFLVTMLILAVMYVLAVIANGTGAGGDSDSFDYSTYNTGNDHLIYDDGLDESYNDDGYDSDFSAGEFAGFMATADPDDADEFGEAAAFYIGASEDDDH